MKEIATSENEAAATVCRCTVKELQHIWAMWLWQKGWQWLGESNAHKRLYIKGTYRDNSSIENLQHKML
jgi:hypothetical protein